MPKEDSIEVEGIILDLLPNAFFDVELLGPDGKRSYDENGDPNGKKILCHLSGKLRMNYIKILKGDYVKVEISPYDLTKGRITWRSKNPSGFDRKPVDTENKQ